MNDEKIISFLKEIQQFKTCERTCQTTIPTRQESDAEHSWHLGVLLMLLEEELTDVDFNKILKLALIHDLPEIYAGDTNPYVDNLDNKEEDERQAAEKLFSRLSEKKGAALNALFLEYLEQRTPEAKIVKSADKLMPLIQNICTNTTHSSYRNLKVDYHRVTDYMDPFFKEDNILKCLYQKLLLESKQQGVFYTDDD